MCALMGASGAGKSTLLDVLAARKTTGRVAGVVRYNAERAPAALAHLPDDVVLVLVGAGPDEAGLRQQVAQAGLGHRVRFGGNLGHDDLPLLLGAAEAMVLASEREGIANAWIEALASGAALVIPDVGGAREV
eukprot:gene24818-31799_t